MLLTTFEIWIIPVQIFINLPEINRDNIQSKYQETGECFSSSSTGMHILSITMIIIDMENPMKKISRKPTHPGKIIKEDYLVPLSVTITELSSILGVSRKTLSKIINEHGSITPDMALRLSRAFDTTPVFWLNLQKNYDLWHAEHKSKEWLQVKPFSPRLLHADGWSAKIISESDSRKQGAF